MTASSRSPQRHRRKSNIAQNSSPVSAGELAVFAALLLWRKAPRFVIARPQRGRGNLMQAVAISPMASLLSGRVLRDCHVASLLAMTRQESARCTSALARLNCPPRGAQGTPLHFPSGPFRVFCAKKYRKHRLPVVFQTQSITINHNQLFTSRRPSSGGRSGAGRPHSPEPSGPRAAACSNR